MTPYPYRYTPIFKERNLTSKNNSCCKRKTALTSTSASLLQRTPYGNPHTTQAFLANMFLFSSILVILALLYLVHGLLQHVRLRHFKGPRTVEFSKIWLLRCVTSGMMHHRFLEVSQYFGMYYLFVNESRSRLVNVSSSMIRSTIRLSTARIGPQTLLTCDVELIRRMNAPRKLVQPLGLVQRLAVRTR